MPSWLIALAGTLFILWVLANMKTSRPDGDLVRKVHPYRRLMAYIMPTRNESIVYFDSYVLADNLVEYLAQVRGRFPTDISHCLVGAVARGLANNPKMNQFVVGKRLYQRRGRWITFSMKRKRMDREAGLSVVKVEVPDGETFQQLCERIDARIHHERSGTRTHADKEYDLFGLVPRPVLARLVGAMHWLDDHNLLPAFFIRDDALYTSVFVANLGSVGMAPGYHHLYEWGNCPLFLMAGQIEERAIASDGGLVVRRVLPIRYSYDERIDDGLTARFGIEAVKRTLEDPFKYLGCLAPDGSDAVALDAPLDAPTQARARLEKVAEG